MLNKMPSMPLEQVVQSLSVLDRISFNQTCTSAKEVDRLTPIANQAADRCRALWMKCINDSSNLQARKALEEFLDVHRYGCRSPALGAKARSWELTPSEARGIENAWIFRDQPQIIQDCMEEYRLPLPVKLFTRVYHSDGELCEYRPGDRLFVDHPLALTPSLPGPPALSLKMSLVIVEHMYSRPQSFSMVMRDGSFHLSPNGDPRLEENWEWKNPTGENSPDIENFVPLKPFPQDNQQTRESSLQQIKALLGNRSMLIKDDDDDEGSSTFCYRLAPKAEDQADHLSFEVVGALTRASVAKGLVDFRLSSNVDR